jgi:hypothetical protein
VARCDAADPWGGLWTDLYVGTFNTPIVFDTEYTLSVEFTGSTFILKCDDEAHQYNVTTTVYPPSDGQYRQLQSRIWPHPGESGYMKANFDDVYTGYTAEATYDATGTWDVTETDVEDSCDPNVQPETSTITITQSGNDVTMVDDEGNTFTGTANGSYYTLYGEFLEQGETTKVDVTFVLSSSTAGSGSFSVTWTDGVNWCEGGALFTITKQPTPTVTTGSATSVTSSSATLNGTINPNGLSTTYYFEYGTTTSYGSTTSETDAGSGTDDVSVSADLTGLSEGMTYHFRLVATNSGGTSYGDDATFTSTTTPAPAPTVGGGGGGGCFIATAAFGSNGK